LLPRIRDLTGLWQPRFELGENVLFAALAQRSFELKGAIEMIIDRALAAAGDKEELLDARRLRLFDLRTGLCIKSSCVSGRLSENIVG
jgi:hypothetical protein